MVKIRTLSTLFNGAGAPPAPWTVGSAGGGADPVQGGGALAFPGVLVGGSDSELAWAGDLDLANDRVFLQFESLIGLPGTVELDLTWTGGWLFAMQLRNGSWTIQIYNGINIYDLFVGAAADLDARCWAVSYTGGVLSAFAGPTPWQLQLLGSDSGHLLLATTHHLVNVTVDSKNMETFDVAYGQTRLIGFNAWQDPQIALAPPVTLPCDVCGKLDTLIANTSHAY